MRIRTLYGRAHDRVATDELRARVERSTNCSEPEWSSAVKVIEKTAGLSNAVLAARAVADEVDRFVAAGDAERVIMMAFDQFDENSVIAELLDYRNAGWKVEFYRGCAALILPEVLS